MAVAVLRAVLPVAQTVAAVRGATAEIVVLIVGDDLPAVERVMLIAALAPLAIERAPAGRLCAIDLASAADPADVDAAIAFLTDASSTTGQVLAVG